MGSLSELSDNSTILPQNFLENLETSLMILNKTKMFYIIPICCKTDLGDFSNFGPISNPCQFGSHINHTFFVAGKRKVQKC